MRNKFTRNLLLIIHLNKWGVQRFSRIRKSAISSDYLVYLQESVFDVGPKDDPSSFSQAMSGSNSTLWFKAMQEEMESMAINKVWDLVELPQGALTIGCKWVYKDQKGCFW